MARAPVETQRLYSIEEAAAMWSVSRDLIERLIARGELRYVMVGQRRRVPASTLEEYRVAHEDRV